MSSVLSGIRVIELASYALVPFAGSILAEWGADVIKVEHPLTGDPIRNTNVWGIPPTQGYGSFLHEITNRGKRSIGLDIGKPEGYAALVKLIEGADVFITNMLPAARRRFKIEYEDLKAINPRLVYARGSGMGQKGPEAEAGGFDSAIYWARAGVALAVTPQDMPYPLRMPGPAFGDSQGAISVAAGICAALVRREREGIGAVVDVSLLGAGMWAMQTALSGLAVLGRDNFEPLSRVHHIVNPLSTSYRTADGRFIQLSMLQSDRYWPNFCSTIGKDELLGDPRFTDAAKRSENRAALVEIFDAMFGAHPTAHWQQVLARQNGPWAVIALPGEVLNDPQALANGYVQTVAWGEAKTVPAVHAPVSFDGAFDPLKDAPPHAMHTEEVLLEAGFDWADIAGMKSAGAIP